MIVILLRHTDFMQELHYVITDLILITKIYHLTEFSLYYIKALMIKLYSRLFAHTPSTDYCVIWAQLSESCHWLTAPVCV